jgi:hypothetical protein
MALITHGKPSNSRSMLDTHPDAYLEQARDMARRGWLAARNPKKLLGVVNVSGGLRFTDCAKEDLLVAAFKTFGATSRVAFRANSFGLIRADDKAGIGDRVTAPVRDHLYHDGTIV